jgi:membrane-associated phospholipid phosphatase
MTAEPTALELSGGVDGGPYEQPVRRRWRLTRLQTCMTLWLVLVGLLLWRWHLTTNRTQLFVIIGTGLIATGAARLDHIGRVIRDWLPLFLILFAYDSLRNQADKWFAVHVTPQINADKFMFGGVVPTVWLQHALFTPGQPHWWDYLSFAVYLSHFFAALVIAALLWKFAYPQFKRFAFLFVTLSFAGFATYALFPAAPPWLASQSHQLAPTAKLVDEIWAHLGLKNGASLLSARGNLANPVAAVPSLHAAYPMLLMLFFWGMAGRWRWLLPLYPLAMAFSLVYAGEHYVFDIFLGWLYAIVVYFVGIWAMDAWARRRAARAEVVPAPPPEALVGASLSSPG